MGTSCKAALRGLALCALSLSISSCAWLPQQTLCVEYTVNEGDTIYGIAQSHELDWRGVAETNAIHAPYLIRPGEKLYLCEIDELVPIASGESDTGALATATSSDTRSTPTVEWWDIEIERQAKQSQQVDRPSPPRVISPTPRPPTSTPPTPSPSVATNPPPKVPVDIGTLKTGWQWPVDARPRRGYSQAHKGIDYFLNQGAVVVAARSGEVVYSGVGLSGYKYMIIIRDADKYDTVYEFNVETDVKQYETANRGRTLFRINKGNFETDQYRHFYFQIRKEGKPQDPNRTIASR